MSGVVFLASADVADGKAALLVGVTGDLVARGLKAGALMRRFAEAAGGRGGGSDALAKGSTPEPDRLDAALEAAPGLVREMLQGS